MIAAIIAFTTRPGDEASQGLNVIELMLVTGLVFLLVVFLGELTRWAGHRRYDRKYGRRSH